MKREEAKEFIRRYSNGLWGMVRLEHIDKMVNEIYDAFEQELKAKDEEIRRLNNLYADTIKEIGKLDDAYAKVANDFESAVMEIEKLKIETKKARPIVAMLFWKARRQKKVFLMYYEEYGKNNSLTQCYRGMYEQAIMGFSKAYKMLRGKKCRGY